MNKEDLVIGAIYRDLDSPVILESINGDMAKVWNREASYNAYCSNLRELEFYDYEAHRRSLRPNVKKGQPLIVWDNNEAYKHIEYFQYYEGDKVMSKTSIASHTNPWKHCELMPGYNYNYNPEQDNE